MNTKDKVISGNVSTFRALDLALEALETCTEDEWCSEDDFGMVQVYDEGKVKAAITAIKQARSAPVQEPVLQEIEQYRLQMAGISTAAIGYWKEGDGIHPDYDTPALRDVAKLYAKYDALYTAAQRQWVELTGDEIVNMLPDDDTPMSLGEAFFKFAELVEAKLKEKNQ